MTGKARRSLRWVVLLCCGLGIWAAWMVIQIVAWPQWIEVKNSSSVAAKNVKLEAWDQDGKLIATKQWPRLSPGHSAYLRHSNENVTAKVTFTLDYGPAGYHQRSPVCSKGEGWTFRIMPNGVVLSQHGDADGTLMDRLFPRVY